MQLSFKIKNKVDQSTMQSLNQRNFSFFMFSDAVDKAHPIKIEIPFSLYAFG